MQQEHDRNPDFLKSIISVKIFSKYSLGEVNQRFQNSGRIVFVVTPAMDCLIGNDLHTELTTELGIQENKDLFMKGVAQRVPSGVSINSNWVEFFKDMGVDDISAGDIWEAIRSRVLKAIT